jgi:23S rRNA pseudouridine2605 synthase/16S rRNA pseudouridine516 synthase
MEERIQKILSHAGVMSRRKAERLILEGRILVNGKVVPGPGTKADIKRDRIEVDGRVIRKYPPKIYILLNKPRKMVTTLKDPLGRRTVVSLLDGIDTRVFPVGRLDYDTEGVLLLTNDGDFAAAVLHPRYGIARTYLVKVKGVPTKEKMQRLRSGLLLEKKGFRKLDARTLKPLKSNCWIEMTLYQGRNREIKRLCDAIGHPVLRLIRIRFGSLTNEGLKPCEYRFLSAKEISRLKSMAHIDSSKKKPRATIEESA